MAEVCERECFWRSPEDEPLTLMRLYRCELSQLYEVLERGGLVYVQAYNIKMVSIIKSTFSFQRKSWNVSGCMKFKNWETMTPFSVSNFS